MTDFFELPRKLILVWHKKDMADNRVNRSVQIVGAVVVVAMGMYVPYFHCADHININI